MKKVLIFGSEGFIGTNLKLYFQKNKKYKLITTKGKNNDILNKKEIKELIKKNSPDFIINTAYYGGVTSAIKFSKQNIVKNLNIIQSILAGCRGVNSIKKIVFFGSSLEYADSSIPINENHPINPKNTYATVKTVTSLLSLAIAKEYQLPVILIRPFNLYGPFDRRSVVYYLIKSLIKKRQFQITEGTQIRDYLYIEDFVKIIAEIIDNYQYFINYEIYNLGSGKPTKLREIFKAIFDLTGYKNKIDYINNHKYEYWYQVADIKKIKSLIDIKVENSLQQGLEKTIEWVNSIKFE